MSSHTAPAVSTFLQVATLICLPAGLWLFCSPMNQGIFQLLNAHLVLWFGETFWALLTNLGDGLFLFPLGMLLFWRCPQRQLAIIIGIILVAVITYASKKLVDSPRPGALFDLETLTVIGPLLKGRSMPSGHSATAFLMVGFSWFYLERQWGILMLGIMSLSALSRIAVGAHWPCDIFCGAWVGLMCAATGVFISGRRQANKMPRLFFVSLGFLTFLVLLVYDNGYQHIPAVCCMQLTLTLLTAVAVIDESLSLFKDSITGCNHAQD